MSIQKIGGLGDLIIEFEQRGIQLRMIGTLKNNKSRRGEIAFFPKDFRKNAGIEDESGFEEYIWNNNDVDNIAERNGFRYDLDSVSGKYLKPYARQGHIPLNPEKKYLTVFLLPIESPSLPR